MYQAYGSKTSKSCVYFGALITPQDLRTIKYFPRALVIVKNGIIQRIEEDIAHEEQLDSVLASHGAQGWNIVRLAKGEFLLPGFIDTHTHAPQFPIMGRGGQYVLLDWLRDLVYPTESKFKDDDYAKRAYPSVVRRLLDCGTTTCCYFSSSHFGGTKALADAVNASGQRAFVGNCNVDRGAPADYLDPSAADSLAKTRAMISYVNSLKSSLVKPVVSPRFAVACTDELLRGLGQIAAGKSDAGDTPSDSACASDTAPGSRLAIHTHLSENILETQTIPELFPLYSSYTAVYAAHGLLGPTTILGHGCHVSPEEIALIKKSNAGISHCPTSNFHLTSGVAKVGEWLDAGVKVGLGTDVSGGYSPSILAAIRHASAASKVLTLQATASAAAANTTTGCCVPKATTDPVQHFANKPLPIDTLLYLATLGGAELCNLENTTGSLVPGKAFDALLVNVRPETGNPSFWWDHEFEAVEGSMASDLQANLEKFLFCGDDRNISAVFVEGKMVGGSKFKSQC